MSVIQASFRMRLGEFSLNAELSVPAQGVTAVFGASGSGKTTLLRCMAGLARAPEGLFTIEGETWQDEARGRFVPPHHRACGYVFQEASLFPHLSVGENLRYGYRRVPESLRKVAFDEVVRTLDLGPMTGRSPQVLSGGERQRVAIGRAVLSSPRLLLMDEPIASLDSARKGEVLYYIERLRDQLRIPIVYVSHAIDEVVRLADTMAVMSEGKVIACGSVTALASRLDLRPYLGRFEAGTVVEAVVAAHDLEHGLATLRFDGGELQAADVESLVGEKLRVRIRARDVSLALSAPRDASFLNILSGTVKEIGGGQGSGVDVAVMVGSSIVVARITRKSAGLLGLAPGKPVYALVKSVAIDRHSVGYA
ncbi:MAG TPA: molybdenum ABC transporter ATP-binding protein [Burkholderiales bacterium]|nr:molybdenum ABC transporter ATP-binding protein [Burkholderiales bacterium]